MVDISKFKSVIEVMDYFRNKKTCIKYLEQLRWKGGVICPHCGHDKIYITNRGYKCAKRECHKKFSAISGTIFENTKIGLRYWFAAIYVLTGHKKGISSCQMARDLGVCQKTAWFLTHRIRTMMLVKAPQTLQDKVEVDETFIGGKNKNRHKNKKVENSQGRSAKDKTPVVGLIQRDGRLITMKTKDTSGATLNPIIQANVADGATVITDEWLGYSKVREKYEHMVVNHNAKEYVRGVAHTNTIENYWSLFKRGIYGTYHHVSEKHLDRYCDEFTYRFNSRKITDRQRFEMTVSKCAVRLRWKDLVEVPIEETTEITSEQPNESEITFNSMKEYEKYKEKRDGEI